MHDFTLIEEPPVPEAPLTGLSIASTGQAQAYKQDLSQLFPKAEGEPLLIVYDINGLVAGTPATIVSDSGIPEFWYVSIRPVAGVKVSVFNGPESSGVPFRLGGGGSLKVRAKSEFLTVIGEAGSPPIVGTVVATRKMEFEINGGAV
jgi:hypothetical protein